jgi:hypothetical protein
MHRRSELSLPRALWIILVRHGPPRPAPRSELRRWRMPWWFGLIVAGAGAFLAWAIWIECQGWWYQNRPIPMLDADGHRYIHYNFHDYAAAMLLLASIVATLTLFFVGAWWWGGAEARRHNRGLRSPVAQRIRAEVNIQRLERDLGFGDYDSIRAIVDLVPREEPAPVPRPASPAPVAVPVPEHIDLDPIERMLLAQGAMPCSRPSCPVRALGRPARTDLGDASTRDGGPKA